MAQRERGYYIEPDQWKFYIKPFFDAGSRAYDISRQFPDCRECQQTAKELWATACLKRDTARATLVPRDRFDIAGMERAERMTTEKLLDLHLQHGQSALEKATVSGPATTTTSTMLFKRDQPEQEPELPRYDLAPKAEAAPEMKKARSAAVRVRPEKS